MFMRAIKRARLILDPAVKRAKPLTRDILDKLNIYLAAGGCTYREWRTIWRVNIMFHCLLCFDDVCRLQVNERLCLKPY